MSPIASLQPLAALLLASAALADELTLNFETTVGAFVAVDPNATAAVAVGDAVAYVTLPESSGETRLELFDAAGGLRWSRAVTSPSNPGTFRSICAADGDSLVLTLTTRQPSAELVLLVEAFHASSGLPAWNRTLTESAAPTSLDGELRSAADLVAVLRTSNASFGAAGSSHVSFLDVANGALRDTSATSVMEAPNLFLDPAATLAVLWNRDGALEATDPSNAAALWSQFTDTLPTSLALGSGATALALGGGGQVLARSDGAGTMAFDSNTGALLWSDALIPARDVVTYDETSFFAAGMVDFGGADGDHRFGRLNAFTGQTIWLDSTPLFGAASSALWLKHVHAGADAAANRVAFARQGLFVLNATTGEVLSATPLDNGPDGQNDLLRLSGAEWVTFSASPLFGPVQTLQAFAPLGGAPFWTVGSTEQEPASSTSVWCDMPTDGETAHSIWAYPNFEPLAAGRGFYQVRDASSGDLLASWPLPFVENRTFALSPDGSRIAVARIGSSGSSVPVEVELRDPMTGALIGEHQFSQNAFTDPGALAWRANSNRLTVAFESISGLIAGSLSKAGAIQWTRTVYPFSGGNSASDPILSVDPSNGDVFLSASLRESIDRSLYLAHLRGSNGQILGTNTWNPPDGPGTLALQQVDEPLGLFVAPADDRGYAVVVSNSSDEVIHVVAFALSDLGIAGELPIGAGSAETELLRSGSVMTSDARTLFLSSVTEPLSFAPDRMLLAAVDLPDLELRWQERIDTPQAKFGQVALLNDRVAAVATANFSLPGTLGLIDLADGATLAVTETPEGFGVAGFPGSGEANLAGSQGRLCLLGERQTTLQVSSIQGLEAGPLLTSRSQLSGGPLNLLLDTQESSTGRSYWFLGTRSGTTPGVPLGSVTVPLNLDGYSLYLINKANQPPLINTFGNLDNQGTMRAQIVYPTLDPSLFGQTLHHAAITWDPLGFDVDFVTEALPLTLG